MHRSTTGSPTLAVSPVGRPGTLILPVWGQAMRILHVTPFYEPCWAYGGMARASAALCRALVARGHEVTVTTALLEEGVPPRRTEDGVRVLRFPGPRALARRLFPLARGLRSLPPGGAALLRRRPPAGSSERPRRDGLARARIRGPALAPRAGGDLPPPRAAPAREVSLRPAARRPHRERRASARGRERERGPGPAAPGPRHPQRCRGCRPGARERRAGDSAPPPVRGERQAPEARPRPAATPCPHFPRPISRWWGRRVPPSGVSSPLSGAGSRFGACSRGIPWP